jgi:hypothetical protein
MLTKLCSTRTDWRIMGSARRWNRYDTGYSYSEEARHHLPLPGMSVQPPAMYSRGMSCACNTFGLFSQPACLGCWQVEGSRNAGRQGRHIGVRFDIEQGRYCKVLQRTWMDRSCPVRRGGWEEVDGKATGVYLGNHTIISGTSVPACGRPNARYARTPYDTCIAF